MPASDSLNASQNVIVSAYAASALFSVTVFCDFSAPLPGGTPMLSPLSSLAKFCAFPPRLPHRNFTLFLRFIAVFSHFSRCTSYKHHTTVFRLRSFAHSHLSEHCTAFLRLILPHRPAIPCRAHFFHFPRLACTFVLVASPTTTKIAPRSTRAPAIFVIFCTVSKMFHVKPLRPSGEVLFFAAAMFHVKHCDPNHLHITSFFRIQLETSGAACYNSLAVKIELRLGKQVACGKNHFHSQSKGRCRQDHHLRQPHRGAGRTEKARSAVRF